MRPYVNYTKFYKPERDDQQPFPWHRPYPTESRERIRYHECYEKVHKMHHQTKGQS